MNFGRDLILGLSVDRCLQMKQRVVIIGQGYTGRLSIVRSVAEMGCDVTIIVLIPQRQFNDNKKKKKPLDAYSKYVSRCLFSENYNTGMLIDILMNQCVTPGIKTFIFPDNDFSAAAIDQHHNLLKKYFYLPHIHERQGAIEEWMDKVRQKKLATELGLDVASSTIIEVRNKQFVIPANIKYPCFAKALISKVGSKWSLKKCEDKEELQKHLEMLPLMKEEWKNIGILVEEFKQIDAEYALLGFSDGETVVIPGIIEILKLAHGTHFGVAVQGAVYPVPEDKLSLIAKFKELILRIGFVGIFDIDFYESQGIIYFCEINMRFGGSGYAYTRMGVNLPVMMIKSFLGESVDGMNKVVTSSATFFNERMAMDDWYGGYISTKEFFKLKNESDIRFVENAEDCMPQIVLDKEFRIKRIKSMIKGWIGK